MRLSVRFCNWFMETVVSWVRFICLDLSTIFHATRKEVNSSHPVTLNYSETISIFHPETLAMQSKTFCIGSREEWMFVTTIHIFSPTLSTFYNTCTVFWGCPSKNILMSVWSLCVVRSLCPTINGTEHTHGPLIPHSSPLLSLPLTFYQCKIQNANKGVHRVSRVCAGPHQHNSQHE